MKLMLSNLGYQSNPQTNVLARPEYSGIAYNDGDEIEQRIAAVIEQSNDVTVLSSELRQHCTDWPSLYHLSSTRANILRPFEDILNGANVLEIGAGCGAITRYMGECGAKVLALEGSPRRAAIARSRTRDLLNVVVVSDRFSDFKCNQQFDVITLIGVLEYANLFTEGENPALAMLEQVRSLLKPAGKLIVAIENQLGLKYFAGAREDHIGEAMYGIEGRYQTNQPHTYGRQVLADLIKQAGFSTSEFLAPFPDYKLPVSILTEAGINNKDFDAAAFAWQSVRRDPQLPPHCNFSPELAWPEIFKNGLGLEFANSFLIVASPAVEAQSSKRILAYHYSTDRIPQFCKETVFSCDSKNKISLHYRSLGGLPVAQGHSVIIKANWPIESPYVHGFPLSWEFIKIVSRDEWSIEEVGAFIKRYVTLLGKIAMQSGRTGSLSCPQGYLPGNFFDITPQNILITKDDIPVVIDLEWTINEDIVLERLLFRSLLLLIAAVTRFGTSSTSLPYSRGEFVKVALESAGYSLDEKDFISFIEQEAVIQEQVTGRSAREFLQWFPEQLLLNQNINQIVAERDGQIASLHQAMAGRDGQIASLHQAMAGRDGQIASLHQAMAERDGQIASLHQAMAGRDGQIASLHQAVAERDGQIASLHQVVAERDGRIAALYSSTSWQIMAPIRIGAHQVKRARRVAELILPAVKYGGGLRSTVKKAINLYRHAGLQGIKRGFRVVATKANNNSAIDTHGGDRNDYAEWIRRYATLSDESRTIMRAHIEIFSQKPLISVVMPTYNPKPELLVEAIESVRKQIYPHWELCIADDASTDKTTRPILERYAKEDSRIKVIYRDTNGHISASSNSALEIAAGSFVALLDNDDLLSEDALFWVVDAILKKPDAGIIYSDEDKTDLFGKRSAPYFKSDWNPDLFLSHNMICHLGVYRTELVRKLGGFREGYEGAQDYDLALRCVECLTSNQIVHIPRVLYHWRSHPGSTALAGSEKNYALSAGERALNDHLKRAGIAGKAEVLEFGMYRVRYSIPVPEPMVSLIIPTRNGLHLIRQCVDSILAKTIYSNYEILIVDNGSDDPGTLQYFGNLAGNSRVRVLRDDRPFNYSALNNAAVKSAQGELIALINNDIEVISSDWLSEMVSHALRSGIGAVGARLWYPNDTLQHGGVILGIGGVAGHSHKYLGQTSLGYFGRANLTQNLSAVTAACLVIKKSIYQEVGGLNEEDLRVAFNDVDFCLRVREAGYRNVWTPFAELYHHESATRGVEDTVEKQIRFANEVTYMKQRWEAQLRNDPAYSPNLTLEHEDFSFAWPPRSSSLNSAVLQ